MGRISKRLGTILLSALLFTGCGGKEAAADPWLEAAALDAEESPEELYEKALTEDVLIVYTVSTRLVQTKESFEAAYPGLSVELRDVRSPLQSTSANTVVNSSQAFKAASLLPCCSPWAILKMS